MPAHSTPFTLKKLALRLITTTTLLMNTPSAAAVLINEIDADTPGTDVAEFIELYDGGLGNTSLDGMVLVFFNGGDDQVDKAYDLTGHTTDAGGYFTVCGNAANINNCSLDLTPDSNLIQNGADAVALYYGSITQFPANAPLTTTDLIDAVVYGTADPDDPELLVLLNPGQPQVDENGGGDKDNQSIQLCPDGSKTPRDTDAYRTASPTPGMANDCTLPTPDMVQFQARAFLQGAYDAGSQLMRDDLRSKGLLPLSHPYNDTTRFNYTGMESLDPALLAVTGNDAPVDWVLLELRAVGTTHTRLAAKAALLQRDGDVVEALTGSTTLSFDGIQPGDYQLSIRHRNHLGIMTQHALSLSAEPVLIDFTDPALGMSGDNGRVMMGQNALLWAGETDTSNSIISSGPDNEVTILLSRVLTATDNTELNGNYRLSGYAQTDLNLDGITLYAGPDNDSDLVLSNTLLHPDNQNFAANFIIFGRLPTLAP